MASQIPALVVGLCTHGLAICRSLGRRGIPVYALESNKELPGLRTRYTKKRLVANVNGPELIEDLIGIRKEFDENPVLFLTNDNMVKTIAKSYDDIHKLYRINWPLPDLLLTLLEKENLENFAKSSGLLYPKTFIISHGQDLDNLDGLLQFPVALKPSQPLSTFKALKVNSADELRRQVERYRADISCFLLQEWISGTERNIYFSNFYFDKDHRPIAEFIGRKIRAFPRYTGGACSAEPCDRDDLLGSSLKFFRNLPIRGPASLEIKEDRKGYQYVIEPTIGRFDFYILCCIQNGVDMPYIAYMYQTENNVTECNNSKFSKRRKKVIWMDFEKDFPVYLESLQKKGERRESLSFLLRKKVFALWAWDDIKPSIWMWPKGLGKYLRKFMKRAMKLLLRNR